MESVGRGRVVFWEGGSLWLALVTGAMDRHSHHAIQLCLPIQGKAQFLTDAAAGWITCAGAVITPDVPHVFHAPGSVVATILFEPESVAGRGVLAKYRNAGLHLLPGSQTKQLVKAIATAYFEGADDALLVPLARQAVETFAGVEVPHAVTDRRVLRAIAEIRQHLDEPITLPDLARKVGLSSSRLRHLFVAETGVSFRGFLLWERLNRAMAIGFGGASWTEAAHEANFADSAHLSRTCHRMFGFAPSRAKVDQPDAARPMIA